MQVAFVELEGKDGHVLIPKSATILAIREESSESNRFWLECVYCPFPANPGFVEKKSFLVNGPKSTILAKLNAETTAADPRLRERVNQVELDNTRLHNELMRLKAAHDALKLDHVARVRLDTAPGQWDDPTRPSASCPALWASYRLTPTHERNVYLFRAALGTSGAGFSYPLGKALTNMKEAGRTPFGMATTCYGVKLEILRGHHEDIAALKRECSLHFEFDMTIFDICPVGGMTWDEAGLVGHFQFASNLAGTYEPSIEAQIPAEDVRERYAEVTQIPDVELPTPRDSERPSLFTRGGSGGIRLESFAIGLEDVNAIDFKGEDLVIRVTLAVNYVAINYTQSVGELGSSFLVR